MSNNFGQTQRSLQRQKADLERDLDQQKEQNYQYDSKTKQRQYGKDGMLPWLATSAGVAKRKCSGATFSSAPA